MQKKIAQAFNKKQKNAEKAKIAPAIAQKKFDYLLAKQYKKLANFQKRLAAIKLKKAAATAAADSSQKTVKKAAPNHLKKATKKVPNAHKK